MPASRPFSIQSESAQSPDESATTQTKRCSVCQRPLNADTPPILSPAYVPESTESANFCGACREARLLPRSPLVLRPAASAVEEDGVCDIDVPRRVLCDTRNDGVPMHVETESSSGEEDVDLREEQRKVFVVDKYRQIDISVSQSSHTVSVLIPASPLQHSYPQRNPSPISVSPTFRHKHQRSPVRQPLSSPGETSSAYRYDHDHDDGYPDPLVDITRLRVRSKGYKCLQPGSTFRGTQKSGRNSYDVNVTVVDVDFDSSFLCGYLRIRGLTDDWPELTTYFDAQIIGMRHGFDTQNWGATHQEDMVHWARFPAFRAVQKELIEPRLLLPANTSRPAVFMRWKERFLVPDHRVQDISGASFAGFYYVCVEFDPEPKSTPRSARDLAEELPVRVENGLSAYSLDSYPGPPTPPRMRTREDEIRRKASLGEDGSVNMPAATMCGFYYHKNSEPYQQLSLMHVEDRFHSSFEFR